MVHWVLCCVLIATSIRVTSGINCRIDQYIVNQTGKDPRCLNCGDCHPGYGRYPPCGSVLQHPPMTSCEPCKHGSYSDTYNSMPCRQCHQCTTTVVKKCTNTSNTICSSKCGQQGLYYEEASHNCQRCSHCCGDERDIVIPECVYQGMAKDVSCTIHNAQRCTPKQMSTSTSCIDNIAGSSGETRSTYIPSFVWVVIAVLAVLVLGLMMFVVWHFVVWQKKGSMGAADHECGREAQQGVELQDSPAKDQATIPQDRHSRNGQPYLGKRTDFVNPHYSPSPDVTPRGTPINTDDELDKSGPAKEEKKAVSSLETAAMVHPKPKAVSRQTSVDSTGSQGGKDKEKRSRKPSITKLVLAKKDSYSTMNEEYASETEQTQEEAKDPEKRSRSRSRSTLAVMEEEEEIVITRDPRPVTILEGKKLELKCEATGPRDMTYQWLKNGEPVDKQTGATLMVQSTKVRDFGFYACTVGKNKKRTSKTAEVDITPRKGTQLKLLTEVSDNVKETTCLKLNSKRGSRTTGIPTWKDLAKRYSMDKNRIALWENTDDAANNLMECLGAAKPSLTVYDFIKALVAIERNDVVMVLVPELTKKAGDEML